MKCASAPIMAMAFFVLAKPRLASSLASSPVVGANVIPEQSDLLLLTGRRGAFRRVGRGCAAAVLAVSAIGAGVPGGGPALKSLSSVAHAAEDCYADCLANCRAIAPKDTEYCEATCKDYCSQTDRRDGLSGSVSYEGGEVGILGGTFGSGTVVKGQDKPPSIALPGLDFTSARGKKLLGY